VIDDQWPCKAPGSDWWNHCRVLFILRLWDYAKTKSFSTHIDCTTIHRTLCRLCCATTIVRWTTWVTHGHALNRMTVTGHTAGAIHQCLTNPTEEPHTRKKAVEVYVLIPVMLTGMLTVKLLTHI
jgi:hypothetical protein